MAVHAHSPHDFSKRVQSNVLEELENRRVLNGLTNPLHFSHDKFKGSANGCGSMKRAREEFPVADLTATPLHFGGLDPNMIGSVVNPSLCTDQMRVIDSFGTSTSGRISSSASTSSPVADDLLVAHLYKQSLEIDAFIRFQNERFRLGLEQAHKRHCRSLISLFEQQLVKKLREKDVELENALRKNTELEESARQMSAENQIWYNFAKNNEATVANLKANLEQVLNNVAVNNNAVRAREGYGDSDGEAFPADEAQSCCFVEEGEEERANGAVRNVTAKDRWRAPPNSISCRACREREVGVLLLPCRHLCLCVACESNTDTCPVCGVSKNGSLQIFMS